MTIPTRVLRCLPSQINSLIDCANNDPIETYLSMLYQKDMQECILRMPPFIFAFSLNFFMQSSDRVPRFLHYIFLYRNRFPELNEQQVVHLIHSLLFLSNGQLETDLYGNDCVEVYQSFRVLHSNWSPFTTNDIQDYIERYIFSKTVHRRTRLALLYFSLPKIETNSNLRNDFKNQYYRTSYEIQKEIDEMFHFYLIALNCILD